MATKKKLKKALNKVREYVANEPAPDPRTPSLSLLVKLGSIVVHADEMAGPGGHGFDRIALQQGIAGNVRRLLSALGIPLVPAQEANREPH